MERQERLRDVFEQVGLGRELVDRYPHELSGGQRQRANIARAIVTRPKLVILDEPTSALDVSLRSRIILLLEQLRAQLGLTYLFISHDIATVKYLADRIAVMYLGVIVEAGEAARIIREPLHPYTRALVSAVPIPDPDRRRRSVRAWWRTSECHGAAARLSPPGQVPDRRAGLRPACAVA